MQATGTTKCSTRRPANIGSKLEGEPRCLSATHNGTDVVVLRAPHRALDLLTKPQPSSCGLQFTFS